VRAYGRLPLAFEKNVGQSDGQVRFLSRGAGYALFITDTETVAVLRKRAKGNESDPPAVIRMQLAGANEHPRIEGEEELPAKSNYFIGNDPWKWRTNVPQFAKVRMTDVYRGIDVVYYGNQQQLEYDLVIRPGADPRQIRLLFRGAERVEVDASGDLAVHANGEVLRHLRPVVYQQNANGSRHPVAARYRQRGANEFGVDVASYDATRPLIIDPVLVYSTYLGGSGYESAYAIGVDSSGNAYVAGYTQSRNFPTMNPLQSSNSGGVNTRDAFVAKLNAAGSALIYSTYLGGSGDDTANAIAVDTSGKVYVAGDTDSPNFPTVNPLQVANSGGRYDVFVAKLNAAGSALVYSTYLGGSDGDIAYAIAVDTSGNAYVAGDTNSTNFPTMNPLQAAYGGGFYGDAFVAKLNAAGSALVYSTYLGAGGGDYANAIAVDAYGNAYVAGYTESTNFPTMNPLQATKGVGADAFVAKLNAAGSALIYSTYLGGSGFDVANAIAIDASGNAYVVGGTGSTNFPTKNPLQAAYADVFDAYVAKLNAAGSALMYSTYLGGSSFDVAFAIGVDVAGNAYVAGVTRSTDFPTMNALQAHTGYGTVDAFVAKLNAAGSVLVYSTYFGGGSDEVAYGIAVDASGNAYVAGYTESTNFPTLNPLQTAYGGGPDAFVAKISTSADFAVTKSGPTTVTAGNNITYTIVVTNNGPSDAQTVTLTDATPAGTTFVSENQTNGPAFNCTSPSAGGTGNVVCTIATLAAGASATFSIVDRVSGTTTGGTTITNAATVSSSNPDSNPTNNTASATTIVIVSAAIPLFSSYALMLLAAVIAAIAFARLQR
jgi:uncharacterized repeat protein (TIGR01451 family)